MFTSEPVKHSHSPAAHVPELDGLRGVAILLVIVYHYFQQKLDADPGTALAFIKALCAFTWSGVDLFFVLSGFLIGGILLDARGAPNFFQTFFIRRACRILPLYFAFCLLFFTGSLILPHFGFEYLIWQDEHPELWLVYVTLTQNFWIAKHSTWFPDWISLTWSLAVEEQFYLIIPFAVRYLRRVGTVLVGVIVCAPLFRHVAFLISPQSFAPYVLLPCRADALGLGVLAALLLRREGVRDWLRGNPEFLNAGSAVLFAGVLYLTTRDPMNAGQLMITVGYSWHALLYLSLLLIAVTQPGHLLNRVFCLRPLMRTGTVAYGLYLFHQPVNGLCHEILLGAQPSLFTFSAFLVTVLAAALTFTLAGVSWVYFEKPFVKLGHRYKYE